MVNAQMQLLYMQMQIFICVLKINIQRLYDNIIHALYKFILHNMHYLLKYYNTCMNIIARFEHTLKETKF